MQKIKAFVIRIVLIFISYKSGFYILDKVDTILVHNVYANFFIFVGVYFIISMLLILFWCYVLNDKAREKIDDLDDITMLIIMLFYLPSVIIICILHELLYKINKTNKNSTPE